MKKIVSSLLFGIILFSPLYVFANDLTPASEIETGDFVQLSGRTAVYEAKISEHFKYLRYIRTEPLLYAAAGVHKDTVWRDMKTIKNRYGFIFSPFVRVEGDDQKVYAILPYHQEIAYLNMTWEQFVDMASKGDEVKAAESIFTIGKEEFEQYRVIQIKL